MTFNDYKALLNQRIKILETKLTEYAEDTEIGYILASEKHTYRKVIKELDEIEEPRFNRGSFL